MVSKLEALADAITHFSGFGDPDRPEYQNRNPGALPAVSDKHPRDEKGQRIFRSLLDGYQALLFDLAIKCLGRSRSHLKSSSTLRDLMKTYHWPETTAGYVAKYLKRALQDSSISDKTTLDYFIKDSN